MVITSKDHKIIFGLFFEIVQILRFGTTFFAKMVLFLVTFGNFYLRCPIVRMTAMWWSIGFLNARGRKSPPALASPAAYDPTTFSGISKFGILKKIVLGIF